MEDIGKHIKQITSFRLSYYQNIFIAFNNHFAGFGPQSANTFLKLMDKPEIKDWTKEVKQNEKNNYFSVDNKHQTSLSDFTHIKDIK
jgi:hypothetical protein